MMSKIKPLLPFLGLLPLVASVTCALHPQIVRQNTLMERCWRAYDTKKAGDVEAADAVYSELRQVVLAPDDTPVMLRMWTNEQAESLVGERWHPQFYDTETTLVAIGLPPKGTFRAPYKLERLKVTSVGRLAEHSLFAKGEYGRRSSSEAAQELLAFYPDFSEDDRPAFIKDPLSALVIDGLTLGLTGGTLDPATRRPGNEHPALRAPAPPSPSKAYDARFTRLMNLEQRLMFTCPAYGWSDEPCVSFALLDRPEKARGGGLTLEARHRLVHSDGRTCTVRSTLEVPLPEGPSPRERLARLFADGPIPLNTLAVMAGVLPSNATFIPPSGD